MILPFGIGSGLSVRLYSQFIDSGVKFTHFMLFTGVAYSITAFPVLCRILTEVKLLDTTVGVVVLSAGVGNDIGGRIFNPNIAFVLIQILSWLDLVGFKCSPCQCGIRANGHLHSSCVHRMGVVYVISCQDGSQAACEENWLQYVFSLTPCTIA